MDFIHTQKGQCNNKIDYFSHIHEISKIFDQAGGINDLFWEFAEPHLNFLCDLLHIKKIGAVLLAVLVTIYDGYGKRITEVAESLNMELIEILQLMDEFEILEEMELIQINRVNTNFFSSSDDNLTINLPFRTIEALRKGTCHEMLNNKNLSIDKFFIQVERLCEDRVQKRVSYKNTIRKMKNLLQDNDHLHFVKKILGLDLSDDNTLVLLRFFHYLINVDEPDFPLYYFEVLYEHSSDFAAIRRQLKSGSYELITRGLIENICSDGFCDTESFRLTDTVKEEFLIELDNSLQKMPVKGLKQAGSITAKNRF
jgi:hypothetical protein